MQIFINQNIDLHLLNCNISERIDVVVTLFTITREALGSNLRQDTCYSE
jgi:hypothetical protein